MQPRLVAKLVEQRLASYPAVALVGPRQVGKTTLARTLAGRYFDLEQPAERLRLDLEWPELTTSRQLVVLDEAQTHPEVFPRLRGAIDAERKRAGRFLLLGSVSPSLMGQVSESLAGRLALIEMAPLVWLEVPRVALEELWLRGGYPDGGVLEGSRYPDWQINYLTLLAQRDLPAWGLPAKPQTTDRLLRMLAAVHGQSWNASQVGQSLGLSYPTVNSYLDYLEGAFLIRRLHPYHANTKKRLVKRPKVYWRDTGLLHALLSAGTYDRLLAQPWVGASWEGFCCEQILGSLGALGLRFQPYFFRTSDGYEVDLVIELERERWAIEIKLTSEPSPADMTRLATAATFMRADRWLLVSQTPKTALARHAVSCDLRWLLDRLGDVALGRPLW